MEKETIKVPHERASDYSSMYASGAIISGPGPQGLLEIVFYEDAIGIRFETATQIEDDAYSTSIEEGDTYQYREDKARVTLTKSVAQSIHKLLGQKLGLDKDAE